MELAATGSASQSHASFHSHRRPRRHNSQLKCPLSHRISQSTATLHSVPASVPAQPTSRALVPRNNGLWLCARHSVRYSPSGHSVADGQTVRTMPLAHHRGFPLLTNRCAKAASALARPAPNASSLPGVPRSTAVSISTVRTCVVARSGAASSSSAARPLT